jgi:hypothetical protein
MRFPGAFANPYPTPVRDKSGAPSPRATLAVNGRVSAGIDGKPYEKLDKQFTFEKVRPSE